MSSSTNTDDPTRLACIQFRASWEGSLEQSFCHYLTEGSVGLFPLIDPPTSQKLTLNLKELVDSSLTKIIMEHHLEAPPGTIPFSTFTITPQPCDLKVVPHLNQKPYIICSVNVETRLALFRNDLQTTGPERSYRESEYHFSLALPTRNWAEATEEGITRDLSEPIEEMLGKREGLKCKSVLGTALLYPEVEGLGLDMKWRLALQDEDSALIGASFQVTLVGEKEVDVEGSYIGWLWTEGMAQELVPVNTRVSLRKGINSKWEGVVSTGLPEGRGLEQSWDVFE
ncbi:hypothetical protein M231_07270 [Tremella mesenterica]|uniref:Uncharacterized protein n=1 Tax=Tremella mesenterica TaxID=5217 RepID=A0A4Q1B9J8_TREME|nr:hypothetical protein M231_07270 [Tremella mesenterica]